MVSALYQRSRAATSRPSSEFQEYETLADAREAARAFRNAYLALKGTKVQP